MLGCSGNRVVGLKSEGEYDMEDGQGGRTCEATVRCEPSQGKCWGPKRCWGSGGEAVVMYTCHTSINLTSNETRGHGGSIPWCLLSLSVQTKAPHPEQTENHTLFLGPFRFFGGRGGPRSCFTLRGCSACRARSRGRRRLESELCQAAVVPCGGVALSPCPGLGAHLCSVAGLSCVLHGTAVRSEGTRPTNGPT